MPHALAVLRAAMFADAGRQFTKDEVAQLEASNSGRNRTLNRIPHGLTGALHERLAQGLPGERLAEPAPRSRLVVIRHPLIDSALLATCGHAFDTCGHDRLFPASVGCCRDDNSGNTRDSCLDDPTSPRHGARMTRHRTVHILLLATASLTAPALRAQCVPAVQRLITERKYEAVRAQLQEQITNAPDNDAAMHCLGRLLLEQDESGGAVEWFEKAEAINGTSAQHHLWLGMALRAEGGRAGMLRAPGIARHMKAELEQALALHPTLVDARYALLQYYVQAPSMMGGSIPKAREQAAEMLKVNPMRAHIGTGLVAEQAKDYAAAEKEFLEAISVRPDSDVTYGAAGAYYRRRERWADAIGMSENQLKTMPPGATPARASNAHYFLGLAHEKSGHVDKAKTEYQAAIAANPNNADAKKALASSKDN